MAENALITILKGFKQLKTHPVLFAPRIAFYVVVFLLSILFAFLMRINISENPGFFLFSLLSLFLLILLVLASSYTTAGSIGIAKEIVETGNADFSRLFFYGKKYTFRLVAAAVFITLLRSVSAFFWAPVLHLFGNSPYDSAYVVNALENDLSLLIPVFSELAAPVLLTLLASSVYLLLVSFMFYFVSYIIVIDDMKVFKSYRKSFRLLRRRPIRVSSFVFIITFIRMLLTFASAVVLGVLTYFGGSIYFGFIVHLAVSLFLTTAMTIWVTRFYIILTGKETVRV